MKLDEGNELIRQAISCDICAAEKRQTNHWFVAWEQGGELRVSGWNSRNRLRAGSRHLCGQACLHKLMDEFMARVIAEKVGQRLAEEKEPQEMESRVPKPKRMDAEQVDAGRVDARRMDAGRADAGFDGAIESSARLITPPAPVLPAASPRLGTSLVTMPERQGNRDLPAPEEPPRYATRNWRAEAWERERERATQGAGHHAETIARRVVN